MSHAKDFFSDIEDPDDFSGARCEFCNKPFEFDTMDMYDDSTYYKGSRIHIHCLSQINSNYDHYKYSRRKRSKSKTNTSPSGRQWYEVTLDQMRLKKFEKLKNDYNLELNMSIREFKEKIIPNCTPKIHTYNNKNFKTYNLKEILENM